ncbi:MAG: peptide deformylase [Methanobacteriota archaeon]|nr:MAG: peptide deformylase [Euryarchaeota archaeon]
MAILKVARLGHPVLRQQAQPLSPEEIRAHATQEFIDDMIETMREYDGAGLAANQVHTLKQVAVIEVQANPRYPEAPEIPLTVVINPVVTPLTDEMEEGWEGCLSVPDMRGLVPRYTAVRLEYHDREGQLQSVVAKDFFARVAQHETDHLNGHVYLDRMRDLSTLAHIAEWQKYWLDLFFVARIRETARLAGVPLGFARSAEEVEKRVVGPRLVLLDLTGGFEYERVFAAAESAKVPVLAFTTHALARETQPWHARCARVVTKETLTAELPSLLREGVAP